MHPVRKELERLGPERIRMAMQSFERPDGRPCFLMCAGGLAKDAKPWSNMWGRALETGRDIVGNIRPRYPSFDSMVEHMFEANPQSREELRQECVAFLAEHGTATEKEVACVGHTT